MGDKGARGMSGPTSMTHFEIPNGVWTQRHAELDGLCLGVLNFLYKNPDIATRVVITEDSMFSELKNKIERGR